MLAAPLQALHPFVVDKTWDWTDEETASRHPPPSENQKESCFTCNFVVYLDFLMRILRPLELIPRRHNLFKSQPKNSPGSPHLAADWSPWWPEAVITNRQLVKRPPVHAAFFGITSQVSNQQFPGSNLDESHVNLKKTHLFWLISPIIHRLFSTYELELGMHVQVDKPQTTNQNLLGWSYCI